MPAEAAAGQRHGGTAGHRGPEGKSPRGAEGPWEEGQGSPEGTGGGGRQASPMGGRTEQHSPEVLTPVSPSSPTQTLLQKLSRGTLLGLGLKSLL